MHVYVNYFFALFMLLQIPGGRPHNETTQGDHPTLPGFSIKFTQKGVDFGIEKALEMMHTFALNTPIPDFQRDVLGILTVKISNAKLSRCDKPEARFVFIENLPILPKSPGQSSTRDPWSFDSYEDYNEDAETTLQGHHARKKREAIAGWHDEDINPGNTNEGFGGFSVEVGGINIDLEANIEMISAFFSYKSSSYYEITLSARNISINLTGFLGENEARLKLASLTCKADGVISKTVNGSSSDSGISAAMDSSLGQNFIFSEICDNVVHSLQSLFENELPVNMTSIVEGLPELSLDYSLTEAPLFTHSSIETRHRGAFHPTNDSQNWPFSPRATKYLDDGLEDRMAYLTITDFTINTLWHSLHHQQSLHDRMENLKNKPSSRYSSLLDTLQDKLGLITMEIRLASPVREVFKIDGRTLSIEVNVTAITRSYSIGTKLVELGMMLYCHAEISINNDILVYRITHENSSSQIIYLMDNSVIQPLESLIGLVVKTELEDFGTSGLSSLESPAFKLVAPTILESIFPGSLTIGSDFGFDSEKLRLLMNRNSSQ